MKVYLALVLVFTATLTASAIDRSTLEVRLHKLQAKLDALQSKPDKRIPADILRKARGIVLLDRTKAGFLFAYQGGAGVAMVKDKFGEWSAPAFFKANEASLGFQVGGQQSFVAILLMSSNAVSQLGEPKFDFGGEASGTAGDATAKEEGMVSKDEALTRLYSDTEGLYGGVSVKGGSLTPDAEANAAYYNDFLSTKEILFDKKAKPTKTSEGLAEKLEQYSKDSKK